MGYGGPHAAFLATADKYKRYGRSHSFLIVF
jgi:glycine cleavage system pyridoxal-binding protein P